MKLVGAMAAVLLMVGTARGQGKGGAFCVRLKAMTNEPAVASAHWGLSVTTLDGAVLCTLNEAQLFRPASNAKLFTTAAALDFLGPASTVKTTLSGVGVWSGSESLEGDLALVGAGDGNLSGRVVPYLANNEDTAPPLRYLEELADAAVSRGLRHVTGDVVGTGDRSGDEPYPKGWSVDDLVWGYGAPVSSLSIADNQLRLSITPGSEAGSRATIEMVPDVPYYSLTNEVATGTATSIDVERAPGSKQVRVFGTIALKSAAVVQHIAIEDPAEFAAIALKRSLEQRGVTVSGVARAEHAHRADTRSFREIVAGPLDLKRLKLSGQGAESSDFFCKAEPGVRCAGRTVLAEHGSPPLLDDVTVTNKDSINLHAELLLRRMGRRLARTGNVAAAGAQVVHQFLLDAGIAAGDFVFYDGSGLSTADLVTPRATTLLLTYAAAQTWGAGFKASLPIGGVDGTLASRFVGALKGRVQAKTGTLGESRALSGYVTAASGRTMVFSILVDTHLPGSTADRAVMDRMVELIAAAN